MWSSPQAVVIQPGSDRYPHVTYRDGGFGAVWENDGRIMFSQFLNNQWTQPEFVTPQGDTLNTFPNLCYMGSPATIPLAVYQRSKAPAAGSAIMYSFRTDTGWTRPDTLWFSDVNQKPRFFKVRRDYGNFVVTWNQTIGRVTRLAMRDGEYLSTGVRWNPLYIPSQPAGINTDAAFNGTIIVTEPSTPQIYWSVGVWTTSSSTGRGQITALRSFYPQPVILTETLSGFNRNPDVGTGVFREGSYHIWVAWENSQDSTWKLYGSYTSFDFLSVGDPPERPEGFALHQNYPNPLSARGGSGSARGGSRSARGGGPSTTIGFEVREKGFVSLKVYDVLGREVATLVDGIVDAGMNSVEFNAGNLPSGVYFYQMRVGNLARAKKMLLMR